MAYQWKIVVERPNPVRSRIRNKPALEDDVNFSDNLPSDPKAQSQTCARIQTGDPRAIRVVIGPGQNTVAEAERIYWFIR